MVAAITNQHKLISSTKEMNPIMRKSMSRLSMLFCCRAIHQNPVERPTLGKPENKRCNVHQSHIYIYIFKCLPFDMCLAYSSETWLNLYLIASLLATEDLINLHL